MLIIWLLVSPLAAIVRVRQEHSGFSTRRICGPITNNDVIKWKHFPHYWSFVPRNHRSPVNSPHKGQWRGALMFSLICAWINGWLNDREAGDFRRHRIHYDVIAMPSKPSTGRGLHNMLKYNTCWVPLGMFSRNWRSSRRSTNRYIIHDPHCVSHTCVWDWPSSHVYSISHLTSSLLCRAIFYRTFYFHLLHIHHTFFQLPKKLDKKPHKYKKKLCHNAHPSEFFFRDCHLTVMHVAIRSAVWNHIIIIMTS